jgi:hypothetical protein
MYSLPCVRQRPSVDRFGGASLTSPALALARRAKVVAIPASVLVCVNKLLYISVGCVLCCLVCHGCGILFCSALLLTLPWVNLVQEIAQTKSKDLIPCSLLRAVGLTLADMVILPAKLYFLDCLKR